MKIESIPWVCMTTANIYVPNKSVQNRKQKMAIIKKRIKKIQGIHRENSTTSQ